MRRERRRRRLPLALAVATAGSALAFLALGGIGDDLVYYFSPTELLEPANRLPGATVRLGGLVEAGSIERGDGPLDLRFRVTDGLRTVAVHARTVPPAMFREGIGVIVEGRLEASGVFETRRLMVKHDNEYRAPGEAEQRSLEQRIAASGMGTGE